MRNKTTHGTPCLVPVAIQSTDGSEARGFITRLATHSAAVSSAPVLERGARVTLTFRRPSDNLTHEVVGDVVELMPGGSLWRGRPAALVKFDTRVDVDDLSIPRSLREMRAVKVPTDLVETPSTQGHRPPGLASGLRTGLGRRRVRLGPSHRAMPETKPVHSRKPITRPIPPSALKALEDSPTPAQERWLSGAYDDVADSESTAPPQKAFTDDSFQYGSSQDLSAFEGRHDPFAPSRAVNLDDHTAPPVGGEVDPFGFGPPDDFETPVEDTAPTPDRSGSGLGFGDPMESLDRWTESDVPGPRASAPPPPAPPLPDADRTVAPWEADRPEASLIPRNARIASSVQVQYWARGRKSLSMAQNFSKRGLFLSSQGAPPVRGAIVRIEFPIQGSEDTVSVRFNAEVRWHSADRPQDGLPEGFGVQILTFEGPTERLIYEEFLALILHLDETSRSQEMQFAWGKPGGDN